MTSGFNKQGSFFFPFPLLPSLLCSPSEVQVKGLGPITCSKRSLGERTSSIFNSTIFSRKFSPWHHKKSLDVLSVLQAGRRWNDQNLLSHRYYPLIQREKNASQKNFAHLSPSSCGQHQQQRILGEYYFQVSMWSTQTKCELFSKEGRRMARPLHDGQRTISGN